MLFGVDVMGGDNAPEDIVSGCVSVLDRLQDDDVLVLAGPAERTRELLAKDGVEGDDHIVVLDTPEWIEMAESPVEAVRAKRNSSIVRLAELASPKAPDGERLDAWISAGNTGACVTASAMFMRRLKGVHRPGIVVTVPTFAGPIILVDVGANIEPKPHHLAQYGVMGVYAEKAIGIENPRVALMNVGGEQGTADMKQARTCCARPFRDFKGYIEGRAVFNGEADVIVTDGVLGNVMLKLAKVCPRASSGPRPRRRSGRPRADRTGQAGDQEPAESVRLPRVRPCALMGANGYCLICHGSSKARTICNS